MQDQTNSHGSRIFAQGARDGIPIGLGYFAVAFSLGITAKAIGLTPITCMITSI